jgi:hypothetical protein
MLDIPIGGVYICLLKLLTQSMTENIKSALDMLNHHLTQLSSMIDSNHTLCFCLNFALIISK